MNLRIKSNKYIEKILSKSYSPEYSITLGQINWRLENKETVFILWSKPVLWRKPTVAFLMKRSCGDFALLAPRVKGEQPGFLYDIIDIDEFVKRYAVSEMSSDEEMFYELYDKLEEVKDKPGIGFIETRKEDKTRVYELI